MSVKIISDNSSDELRIDPISKAARVTLYDSIGNATNEDKISTQNSTLIPLAANAVYNSGVAFEDIKSYSTIKISVFSNVASAANGIAVQFSEDGVNADITRQYSSVANVGRVIILPKIARYFRIVYTNGATLQTVFRLTTSLSDAISSNTSRNVDAIPVDSESPVTRSIMTMQGNGISSNLGVSDSSITATAAVGVAVTATVPAPAAGFFNYITGIDIYKYNTVTLTAVGTPILVSTTNIPGAPIFIFPTDAALQGTVNKDTINCITPIKSTTAASATAVACPATTGVIWRINIRYYVGT